MTNTFTFTKAERLTGEITVNNLFRDGKSIMAYPFRVVWVSAPASEAAGVKVLMSVPKKKLKRAVWRNRVKRQLREAYRLNKSDLVQFASEKSLELRIAFIWIPSELAEYSRIERKMKEAISKLILQIDPPVESSTQTIEIV